MIGKFAAEHPWTMDFGVFSNLTLGSFLGGTISVGEFVSDHQKFRFGLTTTFEHSSSDADGSTYYQDTLYSRHSYTHSMDDYGVEFTGQYVHYTSPSTRTSIYIGLGPLISYSRYEYDYSSDDVGVSGAASYRTESRKRDTYSVGALSSYGVEWFFSRHVTLHAEYGLALKYSWGSEKYESTENSSYPGNPVNSRRGDSSESTDGWSLHGTYVLFGVSVGF